MADILRKHPVTVFYAVPTFYAAFLASADAPERGGIRFRRCVSAGEALPADVGRRWSERYGVDILDGIGSTEMLHIFISNRLGEVKYGTTGKPVPGYDVRLVDDHGEVVKKPGEMGELQVRGPTSAVMYWNNREQSRTTFLGEWTRSGDKYVEDEQGYFVYCGRRDDMLKVSGIYVSPFEVEAALQSHPEVLEVAVVGWPDDDALIKPKAFVVLKSPEKASDELERTLQDYCRQKLAVFKYPRWLEFRTELPKTATGKIQRFKLRARGGDPLGPSLRLRFSGITRTPRRWRAAVAQPVEQRIRNAWVGGSNPLRGTTAVIRRARSPDSNSRRDRHSLPIAKLRISWL